MSWACSVASEQAQPVYEKNCWGSTPGGLEPSLLLSESSMSIAERICGIKIVLYCYDGDAMLCGTTMLSHHETRLIIGAGNR